MAVTRSDQPVPLDLRIDSRKKESEEMEVVQVMEKRNTFAAL
jgi:hypothetical protein